MTQAPGTPDCEQQPVRQEQEHQQRAQQVQQQAPKQQEDQPEEEGKLTQAHMERLEQLLAACQGAYLRPIWQAISRKQQAVAKQEAALGKLKQELAELEEQEEALNRLHLRERINLQYVPHGPKFLVLGFHDRVFSEGGSAAPGRLPADSFPPASSELAHSTGTSRPGSASSDSPEQLLAKALSEMFSTNWQARQARSTDLAHRLAAQQRWNYQLNDDAEKVARELDAERRQRADSWEQPSGRQQAAAELRLDLAAERLRFWEASDTDWEASDSDSVTSSDSELDLDWLLPDGEPADSDAEDAEAESA